MDAAFLGVETSLTGRRWVRRPFDERTALALAQRFTLPDALASAMAARGVDLDGAADFMTPRLRSLLPDPSSFRGMDDAIARFVAAVMARTPMAVFGDYDVDGGTSSALLIRLARAAGVPMQLYVPDRLAEGYGPNEAAMRKLADDGVKLVLCVDCGITAHAPLAAAKDAGLDVIVLDHHAAEPSLPVASAIVNPNRLDDDKAARYGMLAACGVTFLFIVGAVRALRQAGYWTDDRAEPSLLDWLDIVALGTICDVVSLTGLNRAFVAQGLRAMNSAQKAGIAALAREAGVKGAYDAYTAGYVLGPRINAGGRVGRADLGARLLATDDPAEAAQIARELNALNTERREIEAAALVEAEAMFAGMDAAPPLIFAAKEGWHPGVIGIVAARLKEKYHRPAVVIALDGDVGKGSGRSVAGIDLGAAVIAARQAGLLVNGGGHRMAAGLTVKRDQLAALHDFLTARLADQIAQSPLIPSLSVDGLIGAAGLGEGFLKSLSTLAPFGTGNPEPRMALADCRLIRAQVVGERHVSLIAGQGGGRVRGIAFRAMESDLGPALVSGVGQSFHLAGHIRADDYRGGGAVQLVLDDAALSRSAS